MKSIILENSKSFFNTSLRISINRVVGTLLILLMSSFLLGGIGFAQDDAGADKPQDKQNQEILDRLNTLINQDKSEKDYKKMLRINKDVDFLYESTIGIYEPKPFSADWFLKYLLLLKSNKLKPNKFEPKTKSCLGKLGLLDNNGDLFETYRNKKLFLDMTLKPTKDSEEPEKKTENYYIIKKNINDVCIECKMEAVEETLGIVQTDTSLSKDMEDISEKIKIINKNYIDLKKIIDNKPDYKSLVALTEKSGLSEKDTKKLDDIKSTLKAKASKKITERVATAYNILQNDEWNKDRIRFGVMAANLTRFKTFSTGISLHAYPAYRRHNEGSWTIENIGRRISFLFSVGAISGKGEDNTSTKSPALFFGMGIDIAKGFSITAGETLYLIEETNHKKRATDSFTVGVVLTSDLWKDLLKGF